MKAKLFFLLDLMSMVSVDYDFSDRAHEYIGLSLFDLLSHTDMQTAVIQNP